MSYPHSFSSAVRKYEEMREKIYQEFKIAYIQEKIKRKLLKIDENSIDILFSDQKFLIDKSPKKTSEESDDSIIDQYKSTDYSSEIIGNSKVSIPKSNQLSEYLDLEAECSEEDEEDNELDEDLLEIIDNSVDNEINLEKFVEERDKKNEEILSKLKKRFTKKHINQIKKPKTFETIDSESAEQFPNFQNFEFKNFDKEHDANENLNYTVNFEAVTFKKLDFEDSPLFNKQEAAIQKLLKKDDVKPKGFFERT